ncbi:MAG: DNA repair protein RecO [Kiritimatiellales bacterium]|nr:DNA repair protein RecO [Kiritimatiellota bacterium]MBL7011937.1 DNA repair protein RecO [Kiritimatiellales bacterium]
MSILKTSAIPLYFTDVSNTSRIVTWLTADYGKLSTIIKGEQRKNSLFRGQYDLFSTSELVFYDRTERGMHIAKECSMLQRRPAFRTDWRACAGAGYISALFAKTSLRHGHEPERFELFEEMLSYAEEYGGHPAFLIWFDLQFADFMGHRLQLEDRSQESGVRSQEAGNGRQETEGRRQAYRFAADHGGLVEPGYASRHRIPATPLAPEAVALLKTWQQADSPEEVLNTSFNPAYLAQIERVLGKFAEYHYDLPPHVRQTASATLRAA